MAKPKRRKMENNHNVKSMKDSGKSSTFPRYKIGILAFLAVVGSAIILKDFGFGGLKDFKDIFIGQVSNTGEIDQTAGGWRLADDQTLKLYDSNICTVERRFAYELTVKQFKEEYHLKKALLLKFRKGANNWTDPKKWTVEDLKTEYGLWDVFSGLSQEIVRKGGNGYLRTTFSEYVDSIFQKGKSTDTKEEVPYVFDRKFYADSDLPKTLKLPSYLHVDEKSHDSLFFLGCSGTGVSFHNHADGWNAVVFGRKRWFLYPVNRTPPGGIYPGFRQLDWFKTIYPNLTEAEKPIECIQEPGEILYLPEGMYHGTINLGDTIAVGVQKITPFTNAMQYIYEENMLRPEGDKTLGRRIELIHKFLDVFPDSAEAKMRLGRLYMDSNQLDLAESLSQEAIDHDPYFILAIMNLALTKDKLDKKDEADVLFMRLLQLNPNMWDAYATYGVFQFKRSKFKEAANLLYKGIKLDPDQKAFYYYLNLVETELGNTEAAGWAREELEKLKYEQKQNS